jgi:SAM-dependent methyltransferase
MTNDNQQEAYYAQRWQEVSEAAPDEHILDGDTRTGLSILSLGCAAGKDIWHLTKRHQIHGIDLSESGVAIARQHGIEARVGSVTDPLPYADRSCDIVVAKDILEHVLDPLSVMKEVRRVLKPGGHLVTIIPNQFYWWFRLRLLFGKNLVWKTFMHDQTSTFEEWNYIHVRFFTWQGVQRLLAASRFEIARTYFDFGCLEHYFAPEQYASMYRKKWQAGERKTWRGVLIVCLIHPAYRVLNLVFPKSVRNRAVSRAPGLLTAAFYLRCRPKPSREV